MTFIFILNVRTLSQLTAQNTYQNAEVGQSEFCGRLVRVMREVSQNMEGG